MSIRKITEEEKQAEMRLLQDLKKPIALQGKVFWIPERMYSGLIHHIVYKVPAGDFLNAVLSNDLTEAIGRADHENMFLLPAYVSFLYNCEWVPSKCWGSEDKVINWLAEGTKERLAEAAKIREELEDIEWRATQDQTDSQ